jgi:hypothetical protein
MNRVFLLIISTVLLGTAYIVAPVLSDNYRRYRGRKTVVCPETGQLAELELKARRASLLSALGTRWLRVRRCSLWPRNKGCAQHCVENIDGRAG